MVDESRPVRSFHEKLIASHTTRHGAPDEAQRDELLDLARDLVEKLRVKTFYGSASRYGAATKWTAHRPDAVNSALFPESWVDRKFTTGAERDE